MLPKFVRTSNVNRFLAGAAALEDRGASEACMAVVTGEAGYGKTQTGSWWATHQGAVFVRVKAACTPKWILTDLVKSLGETAPAATNQKLFDQAVGSLARDQRPIVIDEVEHAIRRDITVLETVRDISDLVEVPVLLLGREFIGGQLRRHRQIWTRISSVTQFQPATLEDVELLAAEKCEVQLAPELLDRLHRESEGHIRQIVKGLANIERIAARARTDQVTLDMASDHALTADWTRTRKAA